MNPDRPETNPDNDRVGFRAVSDSLAVTLTEGTFSDGFVIGVQGKWGSGKSTIANFALARAENDGAKIVRFSPWLVGNRDALIAEFFGALMSAIGEHEQAKKALQVLGEVAIRLSPLVSFAGNLGLPLGDLVSKGMLAGGEEAKNLGTGPNMAKAKEQLHAALEDFEERVIVFIDDLDRLDPHEAVEVLRLIRAVADLPNIIYLVAYDESVLAENLKAALKIEDARSYLEKIVQASVQVPEPDTEKLLEWFSVELGTIFKDWEKSESDDSMGFVSEIARGWIRSPRDLIRVTNALRIYAPPLRDRVNRLDLIFLQILRITDPEFYNWVWGFVSACSQGTKIKTDDHSHGEFWVNSFQNFAVDRRDIIAKQCMALQYFVPNVPWNSPSEWLASDPRIVGIHALRYQPEDTANIAKRWFTKDHYPLFQSL